MKNGDFPFDVLMGKVMTNEENTEKETGTTS